MPGDLELLQSYVTGRSEAAFAELVARHVNLVYSAARRETGGDDASAQDLTQSVFIELARQAPRLTRHPALVGWLYTTVRHVAANWRRGRARRERRELAAHAMNPADPQIEPGPAWEEIAPRLDDAMHELRDADRNALVLRFFDQRSLRDVGESLGLTENAARMRVDRALDRLREGLARRGVTSTASGLAAAIVAGAVVHAPAGLAAGVASTAVATAASTSTTLTLLNLMNLTKTQIVIASVCAVTAVSVPVWQQTRIQRLQENAATLAAEADAAAQLKAELDRLRSRIAQEAPELERLRAADRAAQIEIARLRNEAAAARRTAPAPASVVAAAAPPTATATNTAAKKPGLPAGMSGLMKNAIEQQTVGKLERLKPRLNLTPSQEEGIRAILTRQAEHATAAAERLFTGDLSAEDLGAVNREAGNPEAEIKALLTPEQLTAYEEYKDEENVSNARLAANAELLQMQGALGLTQEDQDRVFNVLYDLTLDTLKGNLGDAPPKDSDPASAVTWQMERKLKALEPVLTPAQLASYRKLQEDQARMIRNLLPTAKPATPTP